MGAPPLLELSGVSRVYGKRTALATMNLRLRSGKCVALLGHNGSGKSTLLRIAAGRDRPSTGTVTFGGKPMNENDPAVRARVAVVGDTAACYPDLTVREHLQLVAVAHGVEDAGDWIGHVMAERKLTDHADALPGALSSGSSSRCCWPPRWSGRATCCCWTSRNSDWTRARGGSSRT